MSNFNIFFASSATKPVWDYLVENKCCKLFSYINERKSILRYCEIPREERGPLFVDSGAFSEYHNGKKVDMDGYIEFINSHPQVDIWAQLDSIPFPVLNHETAKKSSDESWEKYKYMMERVNCPDKLLPIFHFGEPYSHLERILNTPLGGHLPPYIGVGGRHGVSTSAQCVYFEQVFNIIKNSKNPNVKVHAFGMTVIELLNKYPFHSADSTSHRLIAAYGSIYTKTGSLYISDRKTAKGNSFWNMTEEEKKVILDEIERKGFDFESLTKDSEKRTIYNIMFMKDWADNYKLEDHSIKRINLLYNYRKNN